MPGTIKYFIVCGPSGSGLTSVVEKLTSVFQAQNPNCKVAVRDIEDEICGLSETNQALRDAGLMVTQRPKMYDITWNLSRRRFSKLWESATRQAILDLKQSPADIKILSCHLTYYCGRRDEIYSPINPPVFTNNGFIPSHILAIIDDVYDMYFELSRDGQLFAPKDRLPLYLDKIKEDEGLDLESISDEQKAFLVLEWQIGVMTAILNWRLSETFIAENLAVQLNTKFLIWGTKQLTNVAAGWLGHSDPTTIYLSHPISRPRRIRQEKGRWVEVVSQFNELQNAFCELEAFCIMPSAIDEYRFDSSDIGEGIKVISPSLSERWPLPTSGSGDSVMYSQRNPSIDMNHSNILGFKKWNYSTELELMPLPETASESLCKDANILLRTFLRHVQSQISCRDHFFVSWTNGILVYRPLFGSPGYSSGVKAEIDHWKLIARINQQRRAAFVHFKRDVISLIEHHRGNATLLYGMEQEIRDEVIQLVEVTFELDTSLAKRVVIYIENEEHSEILDAALVPPEKIRRIKTALPDFKRKAAKLWLFKKLSAFEIGLQLDLGNQVEVWVVEGIDELRGKYPFRRTAFVLF